MNKVARKVMCLLMLVIVFSPSLVMAQQGADTDLPCDDNDSECMVQAFNDSLVFYNEAQKAFQQGYQSWLSYNGKLFNVDWRFDQNGYAVFRSLFPRCSGYLAQLLADQYGYVSPAVPKPKLAAAVPPWFGPVSWVISFTVALGVIWDNAHLQPAIDRMVEDLQAQGWTHNDAVREANYQIFQMSAGATIAQAALGPLNAPIAVGKLIRAERVFSSGRYYNVWAYNHHAEVRATIEAAIRAAKGPDNGRSYMEWASHHGNGNSDGCTGWIYEPGGYDCVFNNSTATQTCTYTAPRWTCIEN